MNKKNIIYNVISWSIIVGFVLLAKPYAEDFWSRFMDFTNPHTYHNHIKQKWADKSTDYLISKLGHPSIIYSDSARVILTQRKDLSRENRLVRIVKYGFNQRKRSSALSILFFWDEKRTTELSMEILKQGSKHPLYSDALHHLAYRKYEPAYPYVLELAKSSDRYNNGSILMLEDFSRRDTIPFLEGMLNDPNISRSGLRMVNNAIKSIKEKNP